MELRIVEWFTLDEQDERVAEGYKLQVKREGKWVDVSVVRVLKGELAPD
jgi:hypothetical protein